MYSREDIRQMLISVGGTDDIRHNEVIIGSPDKALPVMKKLIPSTYKNLCLFLRTFHIDIAEIVYNYDENINGDFFYISLDTHNFSALAIKYVSLGVGDFCIATLGGNFVKETAPWRLTNLELYTGMCPHYWWQVFSYCGFYDAGRKNCDYYKHYKRLFPKVFSKLESILGKYNYKIDPIPETYAIDLKNGVQRYSCVSTVHRFKDINIEVGVGSINNVYDDSVYVSTDCKATDFKVLSKMSPWNLVTVTVINDEVVPESLIDDLLKHFIVII